MILGVWAEMQSGQNLVCQHEGAFMGSLTACHCQGGVLRALETWKEVAGPGRWGMSSQALLGVIKGSRATQWQGAQAQLPLGKKSNSLWDLSAINI